MNKYLIALIVIVIAVAGFLLIKKETAQAPTTDSSTNTNSPNTQTVQKQLPPTMEDGTVETSPNTTN